MNNDSERILQMLSEGKITVEAERLLEALRERPDARGTPRSSLPISKMTRKRHMTSAIGESLSGLVPVSKRAQVFTLVQT